MHTHVHTHACAHACTRTTRQRSSYGQAVFAISSPPLTASEAEPKGTAVPSHPTHNRTQSCLPRTLGTTALFWGGQKPHPTAHMLPTLLADGDGSQEAGTGFPKGRSRSL